jgi:LPXTG-site transpeptidase (sortase) family protein
LILEEGDVCEGPLTDDEGNDFFEWDEYDEDVYLTDGNYTVQYFYTEDSMKLAATGINLSNMVISSILLLFSGLFLFTKNRKKRLILNEPSKRSLDNIYKNIFILKSKIESIINEKVEILINFNKLNPYIYKGLYTESQNEIIDNLNHELLNLISSVSNIENKFTKKENITKDDVSKILDLISSNKIEFKFTNEELDEQSLNEKSFTFDLPKDKTKNKKINKFSIKAVTALSALLLLSAVFSIGYIYNEAYLSNSKQESSQIKLASMYSDQSNKENSEIIFKEESNIINLENIFNDIPVFESVQDILSSSDLEIEDDFKPDVFGYLEISSISLKQYVVAGTSERVLELGPGHYANTALPGTGGNVGIAGHRTTYGAPFANLDQVQIGDELILTVDSNKFHYAVDEVAIVEAIGGEYVLYNRGDDRLTLTTCHPRYSAKQRLVVTGILTKIESVN